MGGWYAAVSVDSARVRRQLRLQGLAVADPTLTPAPTLADLDRTADHLVQRSRNQAAAIGGVSGLAGALGVPPEIAAQVISALRLAQRLAIVYGFEPTTDRGRMALFRALAAGFEVELPAQGPVGVRVSDLPAVIRPTLHPRTVGATLARAMLSGSTRVVAGRLTRFVPLVSSFFAAAVEHRRLEDVGRRMQAVLRRLAESPDPMLDMVDAVEV